jgi:hypothetical protein
MVRQIVGITQAKIDDAFEDNWLFAVDRPVAARGQHSQKHLFPQSSRPALRVLRVTLSV